MSLNTIQHRLERGMLLVWVLPSMMMAGCSAPMDFGGSNSILQPPGSNLNGSNHDRQAGRQTVKVNPNVTRGMQIVPVTPWGLRIESGACTVAGKPVAIVKPVLLTEAAPDPIAVKAEPVKLSDASTAGTVQGVELQATLSDRSPVPGALDPASVKVWSGAGADRTALRQDVDYTLDAKTGALSRKPGGAIPAVGTVYVDYQVRQVRLDTIEVKQDGSIELKKGVPVLTAPLAAPTDAESLALASVFLDDGATQVTSDSVFPIGPPFPDPTEAEQKAMISSVSQTRTKLLAGEPVTIVFWGDDVDPAGATPTTPDLLPNEVAAVLARQFTGAKIKTVNVGPRSSTIEDRLPSLDKDVLSQKPDLVIVESAADMSLAEAVVKKDYTDAIDRIKAAGSEVVLTTPYLAAPQQPGLSDLRKTDSRANVEAIRSIAKSEGVGLADVSRRWEHLATEGIPYVALLANGIDLPDSRGRQTYVDALGRFF